MKYIAIEGIDGTGKSTIAENIYRIIRNSNRNVVKLWGDMLLENETVCNLNIEASKAERTIDKINLYSAARKLTFDILKKMDDHLYVISDRNFISTIFYNCTKVISIHAIKRIVSPYPSDLKKWTVILGSSLDIKLCTCKLGKGVAYCEKCKEYSFLEMTRRYNTINDIAILCKQNNIDIGEIDVINNSRLFSIDSLVNSIINKMHVKFSQ